jgi:hypothetical protein
VEILFTPYKIINPMYADFWNELVKNNELIARYDPVGAVKTMKGIAMEKFHALKHEYPSKVELIQKFGYDPKQLHHLLRVDEYLERYIDGERYADCLISQMSDYLHDVKCIKDDKTFYTLEEVEGLANVVLAHVTGLADAYCGEIGKGEQINPAVDILLDSVQKDIMTKSIKSMARTIELLFWFIIVCIGITAIAPSHRIDILNILPVLENGAMPVFRGMFFSSFSFGDFLVIMMLMGRVDFEKGAFKKIILYGVFCIIFVTIFYIMFVATFDNAGVNHILALSDISVRSSYPYTQEKLDWLAILIWTIVLLFQIGMYSLLAKNAFCEVFDFKSNTLPIAIISITLFLSSLLLYFNLEFLVKVVSSVPFLISIISLHVVLLIILLVVFLLLVRKGYTVSHISTSAGDV